MTAASSGVCELFFYEAFAEEAERLRHYAAAASVRVGHTPLTIQEAGHTAPPAPVISVRTQSVLPLDWAAQLRGILSRSTGYDHLTVYRAAAGESCPQLGYLPLYCARAVAEQAMLLWTALLRHLPRQVAQFATFHRDSLTGWESQGKTIALFGVGNIGYEIWRIATALGMTVRGVDPVQRHADVTYYSPADALAAVDIIVCAMNLTPANHRYFTRVVLAQAPRRPILVNIARGEFTPATVLEAALNDGLLSGVALDVFNEEATLAPALRANNPGMFTADNQALLRLHQRPEVILTPHNAFNTAEAVERKSEQSLRAFLHYRETGAFLWPIPDVNG